MLSQAELSNCVNYCDGLLVESKYSKYRVRSYVAKESCGKRYRLVRIGNRIYREHRMVWLLMNGSLPSKNIDHIDGDGLNNRIENLRDVSYSDNQKNRKLNENNKSGHVGVRLNKSTKKWDALIQVNRKKIHLGSFLKMEDAISARRSASIKYGFHGNHGSKRPL
jgi:hypothetical protein